MLSLSWSVGVKACLSTSRGNVSSSTLSPKSVLPFQLPLPVSISSRPPPGSTTAPPRERIAESLCGQLVGTMIVWRFEQSVLKTRRNLPLAREISATWPW